MEKKYIALILILAAALGAFLFFSFSPREKNNLDTSNFVPSGMTAKVVLAGGCFWCVESDFEKLSGVLGVVSGYAGGQGENPTYEDYGTRGFREVVEVTYDPEALSYETLVEYLIRHSDPTDGQGSFKDRGLEYAPAVYFSTPEEKTAAEETIRSIEVKKIFEKPLALLVLPGVKFWPAEEYHQDYAKKNPARYNFYRQASGRDAFTQKYWGENNFPANSKIPVARKGESGYWKKYQKPSDEELRKILSPVQYEVTQKEDTEEPFENKYDKNKAEGLYVDILSGEPLYASFDKFDSGTGWPSFVKPLAPDSVVEKEDKGFFMTRTEIRSRYSDSHIGHVFNDGPADRGGKRYCMNSAALRFVPKENFQMEGYGEYSNLFE